MRFFSGNPAADSIDIERVEESIGKLLPEEFKAFVKVCNGGEGFVGRQYLMLFSLDEIVQYNLGYEVERYLPGFLLIGSNGGGEAYTFDYRDSTTRSVAMVPFVGMDVKYARRLAVGFDVFLQDFKRF